MNVVEVVQRVALVYLKIAQITHCLRLATEEKRKFAVVLIPVTKLNAVAQVAVYFPHAKPFQTDHLARPSSIAV